MLSCSISAVSSSSSFLSDSPSTSSHIRIKPFFSPSNRTSLCGFPRALLSNAVLGAQQENGSPQKFQQNNSIADFMRFKRGVDDGGSGELQTALVSYRKKFPWSLLRPFLQVDLVSTIHIADEEYFLALQKELESYDCVLYEMVASRESLENRRNPTVTKRLKGSRTKGFNILGCIQRQIARILMLDFQLDCLNYHFTNWYHADLDYETFKLLQLEKDVGGQASEYPEIEALSRLDFGAAMKVFLAKRLTSELTQVTADVEEKSVIIGERNRVAIETLRTAMDKGHNRIAILYGGGHMPDLGRRLREEFDLIPSSVQWITAWSIRKRDLNTNSLPFLKTIAKASGWPLNRYQTLALLIFSSVLALDLWFWELFFGTAVNWVSELGSELLCYVDNSQII
ncbi:uncharacterized protein LOC113867395 isoform X2 [Abrus precatorius]|uniref:Uncharacterized protein LOC113867395 isoform X2 n=1 Tax=Abrus precatorius TaxID=3816 RepID=A0A8B8LRP7_ABRPR|nr:uncharacterized protein LOC113867395 isoform X2 [Abrus precatorius]